MNRRRRARAVTIAWYAGLRVLTTALARACPRPGAGSARAPAARSPTCRTDAATTTAPPTSVSTRGRSPTASHTPERSEDDLQQADQSNLDGRYQARPDRLIPLVCALHHLTELVDVIQSRRANVHAGSLAACL